MHLCILTMVITWCLLSEVHTISNHSEPCSLGPAPSLPASCSTAAERLLNHLAGDSSPRPDKMREMSLPDKINSKYTLPVAGTGSMSLTRPTSEKLRKGLSRYILVLQPIARHVHELMASST